jgi:hypothetical protein
MIVTVLLLLVVVGVVVVVVRKYFKGAIHTRMHTDFKSKLCTFAFLMRRFTPNSFHFYIDSSF